MDRSDARRDDGSARPSGLRAPRPREAEPLEVRWRTFRPPDARYDPGAGEALVQLRWRGQELALDEEYEHQGITNSSSTTYRLQARDQDAAWCDPLVQGLAQGPPPRLLPAEGGGWRLCFTRRVDRSWHEVDVATLGLELRLELERGRASIQCRSARDSSN